MLKQTILVLLVAVGACVLSVSVRADQGGGPAPRVTVTMSPKGTVTTRPAKRPRWELKGEQIKELVEFLRDKRPEQYDQLAKLRDSDPRAYQRTARALYWFMHRVKAMPSHVQGPYIKMTDLSVKIWQKVRQLREATDAAQKKLLTAELRELVDQRFEPEQVVREYRIAQMEDQIKRLREQLKDRAAHRAQAVDESLTRYLKLSTRPAYGFGTRLRRPRRPRPTTQPAKTDKGK